jgi:hypothetical protein
MENLVPVSLNREALQRISMQRRKEASTLLHAGLFPGAYYLMGYAVECALKACVAKQTAKYDFPDKKRAQESWTHNLNDLVRLAGLRQDLISEMARSAELQINWAIVKDWSESDRYSINITRLRAKALYTACTNRRNGILSWIRQRW